MKINEVSQTFNISIDTLRYYEKIGLIDKVKRENGIRIYQEQDIDRIKFIQCMKQSGMTLNSMRKYFDLYNQGDGTLEERLELLEQQQAIALEQMKSLQNSIDYLRFKINLTKENIEKREGKI